MRTYGRTVRRLVAGAFLVATVSAATPARAADKVHGVISVGTEKVTLDHGFGFIDAKGRVTVVFFTREPDAKEQARAMQDGGDVFGVFQAPNVELDMEFEKGSRQATLKTFSSCHVGFYEFKAGIFDWNTFASGCGATALSGDLKPGGTLSGKLKGETKKEDFFNEKNPPVPYAWDVDFKVTLRKKP